MKKQKRQENKPAAVVAAEAPRTGIFAWPWWYWLLGFGALFIVFEAYGPALHGPFVLDDLYLPYTDANAPRLTMIQWVRNLRPLLMFSFWVNYQMGGSDPNVYHITNVILHFCVAILVMLISARLLDWAGVAAKMRQALAIFAGALFLLHPLQTESVAYTASRSEVLSVLFYYSALAAFLYSNRESMSVGRAVAVVGLFGLAIATKEHALTLPVLILATDFFWNRGGFRRNLALYGLLGVTCAAGAVVVARVLLRSNTAGFTMKDLSPVAYLFTECRVLWIYIRMFFFPFGQNVDPDIVISQSVMDEGAIFGLLALVALMVLAWMFRKKYPLAAYGVFVFLLLIAPTSSVIPIRDVLAERRVYLPFLGLILVVLEFLRRLEFRQVVGVSVAASLVCTVLTYKRSEVWSTTLSLWQDTVAKSPRKMRPLFHLAFAQYQQNDCIAAAANYEKASKLEPPDYRLLVDWANALDCMGREDDAAAQYNAAIQLMPFLAEAYVGLSAVDGKQRKLDDALRMLDQAQAIDAGITQIYLNRGGVYELLGNGASALKEYRQALSMEPSNRVAQAAIRRLSR